MLILILKILSFLYIETEIDAVKTVRQLQAENISHYRLTMNSIKKHPTYHQIHRVFILFIIF